MTEVDEDLGEYAKIVLEKKEGIEFKMNSMAKDATRDKLILENGEKIFTYTMIWTVVLLLMNWLKNWNVNMIKRDVLKQRITWNYLVFLYLRGW